MFNSSWLVLAVLVSTSSFAGISFKQKQLRVNSLMKLQKHAPAIALEAYQRELDYEQRGLSVESRAKIETNLLADKIRQQIHVAYRAALDQHQDSDSAREEVRAGIEKDLELAAPELKEELLTLAMNTLDSIDQGGVSQNVELATLEQSIKEEVIDRKEFLNAEVPDAMIFIPETQISDPNKKEYASKAELMESLVSNQESSGWVSTSNQTVNTAVITKVDSKISLQVKFSFLGVAVEAGPSIIFKREYITNATIIAEGLSPVLMRDGNFDYWKRDSNNKIVLKNGVQQKRFISFTCDTQLQFGTEYEGAGGFKFLGLGGTSSVSQKFVNTVIMTSRRIALPEYVEGKSMTIKYLSELCHNNFLSAHYNNTMTVADSLNAMMRNVVAGLEFSHPKTKCAVDTQCYNWFNKEVIALVKYNNFPRCAEENSREKFRSCQLRGLKGQNCPVYEKGQHTSDGQWEYTCDVGLKCVKSEGRTYFLGAVWSYSKGSCQVIKPKTYKSPFEKKVPQYIELDLSP